MGSFKLKLDLWTQRKANQIYGPDWSHTLFIIIKNLWQNSLVAGSAYGISKFRGSSDFSLFNCNKIWALGILAFRMMISFTGISARKHSHDRPGTALYCAFYGQGCKKVYDYNFYYLLLLPWHPCCCEEAGTVKHWHKNITCSTQARDIANSANSLGTWVLSK